MATQTINISFGPEEFQSLIDESVTRSVRNELKAFSMHPKQNNILTRQETAELLSISLPTLHDYTKRGLIKAHRLGSKVRYKRADIEVALKLIRTSINRQS